MLVLLLCFYYYYITIFLLFITICYIIIIIYILLYCYYYYYITTITITTTGSGQFSSLLAACVRELLLFWQHKQTDLSCLFYMNNVSYLGQWARLSRACSVRSLSRFLIINSAFGWFCFIYHAMIVIYETVAPCLLVFCERNVAPTSADAFGARHPPLIIW